MSENKTNMRVYFKIKIFEKPDSLVIANCNVFENFEQNCPVLKTLNLVKIIPLLKQEYIIDDDPSCARRVRINGIKNTELNFYVSEIVRNICKHCKYNAKSR